MLCRKRHTILCTLSAQACQKLVLVAVCCLINFFTRAQVAQVFFDARDTHVQENAAFTAALDSLTLSADSLDIFSYASPDGSQLRNQRFAVARAEAVRNYVESRYPAFSGKVNIRMSGENWAGLRAAITSDLKISASLRQEILDVIDAPLSSDSRKARLRALPEYGRLYARHFAALRYAEVRAAGSAAGIVMEPKTLPTPATDLPEGTSATVYYRLSNTSIEQDYMDNAATLAGIDHLLQGVQADDILSVRIVGASSPEGPVAGNDALARKRTTALVDYLTSHYPVLVGKMESAPLGENWDGLRQAVSSSEAFDSQALLAIIDSDATLQTKESRLRARDDYRTLARTVFPMLRLAHVEFVFRQPEKEEEVPVIEHIADTIVVPVFDTVTVAPVTVDTIVVTEPTAPVSRKVSNTVIAAKTNLLFDAVTALNFELEVPIADRFSVVAEDVFPWWETGNKYCFQMWEMGLEGRYWFKPWNRIGTEKLRGWFAGVYGMSSKYDFQYDRSLNYQGEYWSAGLTGGYVMPIGRHKRVNLEFSLGLGYLQTQYRHYMPTVDYSKLIRDRYNDGRASYFGPTKAKISLIIPVNFKTRKEEVRYE